ncbi:hypothetical protein [Serratia fonticola]|uniref:hypothetical protein n=1 Tax=Serratia fonticola TaxID=47917 RepID=UPI00301D365B
MNINDTGLTNNPGRLPELVRDTEHLKKLVALWADNTLVHHLAAELLSVREAQSVPVIYQWREIGESYWRECSKVWHGYYQASPEHDTRTLYTAPPAPAVPTVPDAITADNAPAIFEIAAQVERIGLSGAYGAYASGWNACRAAMLQPVSQSVKLPDGWITELNVKLFDQSILLDAAISRAEAVGRREEHLKADVAVMGKRIAELEQNKPPIIPEQGSIEVNDASWKLHDMLTEHGPLNGHQFNNLKGCFYEALKVCFKVKGE